MKHNEFSWKNKRNEAIFAQSWEIETPKANLVIVHGMGEHSTRYAHFASFFVENGFSCYTFDHVGHGKSEGKRGHTESLDELLDGIKTIIDKAEKENPEIPTFLLGHSMGGNLVLNYAMRREHNLQSLIVSAPWLRLAFQPPAIKLSLAGFMNKIYPKFTEKSNVKGKQVTRDETLATEYDNDQLNHGEITTRFFYSIHNAAKWVLDNPEKLSVRTLLFHGTGDQLTDYSASKELAEKVGDNLTFKTYDGWYHELHNEIDRAEHYQFVLDWINESL